MAPCYTACVFSSELEWGQHLLHAPPSTHTHHVILKLIQMNIAFVVLIPYDPENSNS